MEVYDQDKILIQTQKKRKIYSFEGCFDLNSSQIDIYEKTKIKKLLDTSLNGYSSTIFVYGQTGSGKTYT